MILQRFCLRRDGNVKLDPTRIGRDASMIATVIVQHLSGMLGSEVEVTLEIQGTMPGGAPENAVRTVPLPGNNT